MDYTCKTRALSSLIKDLTKEKILLKHKLQRKEGQWNRIQCSELIDSLLRRYLINPTYAIKEDETFYVIDGVQRLSTIRRYLADEFALSKTLNPISINSEEREIAGKKFSKLDDDIKEELLKSELQMYVITEYTEEDVREIFKRLNAGTSLSKGQKSVTCLNNELLEKINIVLDNEFWSKTALTSGQIKKDEDRDIVLQTIMLMSGYEIPGFKNEHIYGEFTDWLCENNMAELFQRFTDSIGKLNELIPEKQKYMKKISLPMTIYAMDMVIGSKESTQKYVDWLMSFYDGYDQNEDFRQYCQSGSASKENVLGRRDYFSSVINSL